MLRVEKLGESSNPIGRRLVSLFLTILIAYVIALLTLRLFESHLLFFPDYPGRLEGDWHPRTLPVEDVWLKAADGTKLHAWWIPSKDAKFTFLAFHGNASNIANRASVYEFLRDTPANVFALEYRGYGHSEGKPSESGIYLDAQAAHEYLVDVQKVDPKTIISFGQSLWRRLSRQISRPDCRSAQSFWRHRFRLHRLSHAKCSGFSLVFSSSSTDN